MQALILAGGEGTRLRPLTSTTPKPVLPLANRPFITFMIDWLASHGVEEVVLSCGFLASEVRAVLGDGEPGGPQLHYVEEEEPLDTAGAVKFAEPLLGERFLVMNGDILADFDLTALQNFHSEHEAALTIALTPVEDPSAYGLVRTHDDGRVEAFLEKTSADQFDTNMINAGAYVLERRVLDMMEDGARVSFERDIFPALVGSGLYACEADGYWLDIGTPDRYLKGTRDILEGAVKTAVGASMGNGSLKIGDDATINPRARLNGPALAGRDCAVGASAQVGPMTVLGDGCVIGEGAIVEHSVLYESVAVEPGAVVRESIVGAGARIGAESQVEGTVVGAEATIGSGSRLSGERVDAGAPLASEK
jgi:mannose-1-phosphate guanylyltransferase